MIHENINLEKLTIVGISVRTNNKKAQSQGDIAKLWEEFFTNNISNKINNKISNDIYCIYTEYESDFTADYTTFLGCSVSAIEELPVGLKSLEIDAGKYLKFLSEGEMPACVMKTWTHIWQENYARAYKADFDIYGEEAKDPLNAKITTYLSII